MQDGLKVAQKQKYERIEGICECPMWAQGENLRFKRPFLPLPPTYTKTQKNTRRSKNKPLLARLDNASLPPVFSNVRD